MSGDLSLVEAAHDNNQTKITDLMAKIVSQQSGTPTGNRSSCALAVDSGGRSALHYAAINGNLELAQFVINQCNASAHTQSVDLINALDGQGQSALHLALANDHRTITDLLLKQSIHPSIKAVDSFGRLPLHWAARFGQVELIDQLLTGVDVNQQTKSGETSLYWAVERSLEESVNQTNCEQIIHKLLDHGAKPSIKNNRGDSVLTLIDRTSATIRQMINDSLSQSNSPAAPTKSIGIDLTAKSTASTKPPSKKMKITLKQKS